MLRYNGFAKPVRVRPEGRVVTIRRLAHFLANLIREEVKRMWTEKVIRVLRFLLCLIWVLFLLTTKAC